MPGLKRMKQVAQFKSNSGRLAWDQRLWLGETFSKATSDHPCSDQLLASGSCVLFEFPVATCRADDSGILVDDLDDPIRIGLRRCDPQFDWDGSGKRKTFLEQFAAIDQDIWSPRSKALILRDVVPGPIVGDFHRIRDRLVGIARKAIGTFAELVRLGSNRAILGEIVARREDFGRRPFGELSPAIRTGLESGHLGTGVVSGPA